MNKRSNVLSLILIALLSVMCVFTLTACGKKTTEAVNNTTATVTTTQRGGVELNVSYDKNYVVDSESINDIANQINVEVVIDGVKQKIDFTVKDYAVTDDGEFIDVTISAYGIEKTVRLPYLELLSSIRPELKPIYNILNGDGDKAFTVDVKGGSNGENSFNYKLSANVTSLNGFEFALTDNSGNALVLFTGDSLVIGDTLINVNRDAIINALIPTFDEADDTELLSDTEEEYEDDLSLESIFEKLSSVLDTLDMLVDSPMLDGFGAKVTKENSTYTISVNSNTVLTVLPMFIDTYELGKIGIEYDEIVDAIDSYMNGALKRGDLTLDVTLNVNNNKVSLGFTGTNKIDNTSFTLGLEGTIYNESLTLPTVEETGAEENDIEITVPIVLFRKDVSSKLRAVIHTANMMNDDDADIVRVTIFDAEEETLMDVVINNHYLFADLTGYNELYKLVEADTLTFYQDFIIDGEEVTYKEYLPYFVNNLIQQYFPTEEEPIEDDDDTPVDPRFENGYGATGADGEELFFNIGVTLEEFKSKLSVYTFTENDEEVPFTDYTVKGFDGSKSFVGDVVIELAPGYETSVYVVICDQAKQEVKSISPETATFELGMTVKDLELFYLYAVATYTDGTVNWEEGISGFEVSKIAFENGTIVDSITDEYTIETPGNAFVIATYNEEEYTFLCYIYDPENPVLTEVNIDCDSITVSADVTMDEIKQLFEVYAVYDNLESEVVEDYEIVDFNMGDTTLTVKYGNCTASVSVEYPEDEEESFDAEKLISYFRFLTITEGDDLTDALLKSIDSISKIYAEHEEEFKKVFKYEIVDGINELTINLNTEENDVFGLINYFFGIPKEEGGFDDIDEAYLISKLDEFRESDSMGVTILSLVETVLGFTVDDVIRDSYLELATSLEDKTFFFEFVLSGADQEYIGAGLRVKMVTYESNYTITNDMIEGSKELSDLPEYLIGILFRFLMA